MFRRNLIPWAALTVLILAIACSKKEEHHDHNHGADNAEATNDHWKEMDDFHMVMAQAFHPYKDSADLQPAKENAAALVEAADKWAEAPLPSKFEGDDEIKFKLNQLKTDASTFAGLVNTGDDKAIGESLTKLHDLFHEVQESWYGAASDEHHEENH